MTTLDRRALNRLERLGGPDLKAKVIGMFFEQARKLIEEAHIAKKSRNLSGVAQALHPLQSSAGQVGALEVQAISSEIESSARRGNFEEVEILLPALQPALHTVRKQLQKEADR